MCEEPPNHRAHLLARAALRPEVGAASAIARYSKEFGQLDTAALFGALTKLSQQTCAGDLSSMEPLVRRGLERAAQEVAGPEIATESGKSRGVGQRENP